MKHFWQKKTGNHTLQPAQQHFQCRQRNRAIKQKQIPGSWKVLPSYKNRKNGSMMKNEFSRYHYLRTLKTHRI